jgi:hypothetical protein
LFETYINHVYVPVYDKFNNFFVTNPSFPSKYPSIPI